MKDSPHVDETDLALLHALQMAPRASWAQLAEVIGISDSTAARRWERLVGCGAAWTTAYTAGGASGGALVEIDCERDAAEEAAELIGADPRAITVELTSGGRDLLVTVLTSSPSDLFGYLLSLPHLPGVRAVRSRVTTRIVSDAASWRLDSLSAEQQFALHTTGPRPVGRCLMQPDELVQQLMIALSEDGRMSATDLAQRLSVSVNTVRRRLAQLTANGWLRARCDVTRAASGHAIALTCWLRVPAPDVLRAATAIAGLPLIRLVATATGPANLVVMAWMKTAAGIPDFEADLARLVPAASIEDRAVTLRTTKHIGRLLDPAGYARDIVPLDIWHPDASAGRQLAEKH